MKIALIIVLVLVGLIFARLVYLAHQSKSMTPSIGLLNGELQVCESSGNCMNTRHSENLAPIKFEGEPQQAWLRMLDVIASAGGQLEQQDGEQMYVWASFRTPLMGYVDDVEVHVLADQQLIHLRSASRVGRSDFGANRKRIELIRSTFLAQGS